MPIAILDIILIIVMLVSAFLAMIRGFVREVLSIAAWIAAAAAAVLLYPLALPYIQPYIANELAATGVTVAGIFLVALILVSYITMRISDFVLDSRIGALDRSLGFLYGAARGLLLLVVAMLFLNWFLDEEQQPTWITAAKSRPVLISLGDQLRNMLPEDADSWLIDTIKDQIQGGDQAGRTPPPTTEATPARYGSETRNSLDQLVQSTEGQ
ncbi:MAG: CvpA family protein [Pseudomonadota bacterium]